MKWSHCGGCHIVSAAAAVPLKLKMGRAWKLYLLLFPNLNRPLMPLNIPKVDDLVLGNVILCDSGHWKVPAGK